jgi:hypothetical protein
VKRLSYLSTGDGYRRADQIRLGTVRTSGGLVLTAGTVPSVTAMDTNSHYYGLQVASGQTFGGMWSWMVPPDYDAAADELRILVACNMAGDTAFGAGNLAQTWTPTIYRKRPIPAILPEDRTSFPAGLALSVDLGCPASTDTIPLHGADLLTKWVMMNCDARLASQNLGTYSTNNGTTGGANRSLAATADASIKPGDILNISIVLSGAHTDAVNIYGIEMWYRSNLAFSDINSR